MVRRSCRRTLLLPWSRLHRGAGTLSADPINPAGPREHGNYSNCFLSYVHDFTGDGWPDVLMIMGFGPRPNFSAHLFLNPKGASRHWDNYNVVPLVSSETTQLVDIDGDGKPELIMTQGDLVGYAKPDGRTPPSRGPFIRFQRRKRERRTGSAWATSTATVGWILSSLPVGGSSLQRAMTALGSFTPLPSAPRRPVSSSAAEQIFCSTTSTATAFRM